MTKIKKYNRLLLILSLATVVGLAGCKKDGPENAPPSPTPQGQAVNPAKQAQKQNTSAKKVQGGGAPVVQKPISSVRQGSASPSMDFTNRKDPFKAFIQPSAKQPPEKGPSTTTVVKRTEEMLPIQSFETEKFKVAGIIAGMKENRALIIDPAGKGYVVKEGMLIGSNGGIISKISATSVEVQEKFRDDNGHVRKRSIKLTLIRKSKESPR